MAGVIEKQRTLLIVEDDTRLAQSLADSFADEGFAAVLANSRESAIEALKANEISLVMLDRMLGREDGFDIIREIRQTDPILPIIMLTGRTGETDRVSGLELGADDYIIKPFELHTLLAMAKQWIKSGSNRHRQIEIHK